MAFDLVTWAPRVGTSGDDLYNIPGATKLDGTIDTGEPTRIQAGSSAGFSTTPTIPELNASSDLNQIYGLANRRIRTFNTLFGTSLLTLTYITPGTRITVAHITTARTRINALRVAEGFANFSFFADVGAGKRMKGDAIAELRKSLRIAGVQKIPTFSTESTGFNRNDNPYNTLVSESLGSLTGRIGKERASGAGTRMLRRRFLQSHRIPDWFDQAHVVSAQLRFGVVVVDQTLEAFNLVLYSSNTDDHTYGSVAVAYNLNNLLQVAAPAVGDYNLPVSAAIIEPQKGARLSFILGTDNETAGGGTSGGSVGQISGYSFGSHSVEGTARPLVIDWG